MERESLNQRLSQIATRWTLLEQAQAGPSDAAAAALRLLMQRYCGAVYRYLLGALRDEDAAADRFQEFALRFLRGDFRRADPERGRFRDYVKKALINLVNDYHREQKARARPLPPDFPETNPPANGSAETDPLWRDSWREELLAHTWAALAEAQPTLFAVLVLRVQYPDMPSPEMAKNLTTQLGRPFSPGNIRVSLSRAREKFADLLVTEVAHSLEESTPAELLQELRELELLQYCGDALDRYGHRPCLRA